MWKSVLTLSVLVRKKRQPGTTPPAVSTPNPVHSPSQQSVEQGHIQHGRQPRQESRNQPGGKPKERRYAQPGGPHGGTSASRYVSATGAIQIGLQEQEEYEEMGYPQDAIYEEADYI